VRNPPFRFTFLRHIFFYLIHGLISSRFSYVSPQNPWTSQVDNVGGPPSNFETSTTLIILIVFLAIASSAPPSSTKTRPLLPTLTCVFLFHPFYYLLLVFLSARFLPFFFKPDSISCNLMVFFESIHYDKRIIYFLPPPHLPFTVVYCPN